jgi:hypothetical protein
MMLEVAVLCVVAAGPGDTRSAEEACGTDRRCRIERLKELNRSRREYGFREADAAEARRHQQEIESDPDNFRELKPWVGSVEAGRTGPAVFFGYSPFSWLRLEALFRWSPVSWQRYGGYTDNGSSESNIDGDLFFGGTGASFFPVTIGFLRGALSPYASAHFLLGYGFASVYAFRSEIITDPNTGEWLGENYDSTSGEVDTRMDMVQLSAGVAWQWKHGLRGHLGFVYREPVYTQASSGTAEYDPLAKELLGDWHADAARFDFTLQVGWAF